MKRSTYQTHLYRTARARELANEFRREVEALRDVRRIVIEDNTALIREAHEARLLAANAQDQRDQLFTALQMLRAAQFHRSDTPAFGCVGTTIRLRSGRYLDLVAPQPNQFMFSDIAGALAKICRFGGQIDCFYSVAEHSFHCAHQAKLDGHSEHIQRTVLLHDAAEAFIGDVVKPLKQLLGDYRAIEAMIEAVIAKKYGVNFIGYGSIVRNIDHAMLIHERQQLFTADDVKWVGEDQVRKVSDEICLHGWDAAHAEGIFTNAAKWLGIEVGR